MKNIVVIIVMLFMLNAASWAQSVSVAQINGTAKDQSGALLPGVDVKVTQTETGLSRSTLTDETGAYRLSNLPVGPYRLEVSLAGFKTYVQTGIVLQVNTNPTVNVVLEIGAVSESIEVKADAAMVETRSDGVGTVVDERRIAELPLNGRQVTQLIQLSGAAVPTGAMGASRVYPSAIGVAIAGAIPNSTNYVLDGGYHNDYNTNVGLPLPMPDALQEFKVETSALPARYGVHPGGTVNAVTKSGTNEFHGTAFEFVRNNAFNAKNPFALTDDGLKRNQFGGTLGGPISQNRLFFFGGFQKTLVRVRPTTTQSFVPTQAMLNGDFSTIASAACNAGRAVTLSAPFVNNQLAPAQFDKFAVKVLKYIPVSSDPCGRITYGQRGDYDEIQAIGRIDYQRSDKHSIFGRYYLAHYNHPVQFDGTNLLLAAGNGTGLGFDSKAQAFVIGDTYTFNPTFISTFRGTVNRVASVRDAGNQLFTYQDLGANVTALYKGDHRSFFPLTITNGFGGSGFPGFFMTNGFQLSQDFDLVRGAHQIAFGVNWIHPQHNGQTAFPMDGGLTFNGSRTGGNRIGMADFFAGLPSEFRQAQSIVYDRLNYIGAYAQDSWRISPRFLANVGIRWEPYLPAHNIENKVHHFEQSWFLEGRKSTVFTNSPPGYLYPGDAGYPGQSNTSQRLAQFGPRLGFVIDPTGDGRQTIRLSYGILYDNPIMWETSHFPLDPPWGNYVIITNPPSSQNPWSTYPGGNPFPTPNPLPKDFAFPLFATYTNLPLNAKPMHMEQWSVNYQKQFGASWLASASYLGNRSVHMWLGVDINHATYIPGQSTTANTNLRRKLYLLNPTTGQYYADILQMDDGANANYNGMLLSLQKRFSGNLSWNTNYTWSKCMNDGEAGQDITNQYPDPDNRRSNHGPCGLDRAAIINSSLLLESPKMGSAMMRGITGGWQLSAIFSFQSGDPLSVTSPGDLALIGTAGQRAILVGDPHVDNPTIDRWFNTAAFTPNTPGVWGNVGRNTLRGPKVWNIDSSVSRRFQLNEKQRIELRAEAFNIFNHFTPGDPTTAINSANFGRIISVGHDPRILQFAVKYGF